MSELTRPLIVALDFDELDSAMDLVDKLDPATCRVKVGKQLFTRVGLPRLSNWWRENLMFSSI